MKERSTLRPNRPLSANFTDSTLRRAIKQKRQVNRLTAIGRLFFMKKQFWMRPAGALTALALVVVSGAGVYAATNWFNGAVKVTKDNSIITVDLSQCATVMPPGVDSDDRSNVKFKITGTPHISAEELQRKLLLQCEYFSAINIYQEEFRGPTSSASAVIEDIDEVNRTITARVDWGGQEHVKQFKLAANLLTLDKGSLAELSAFKKGDTVVLAYNFPESYTFLEDQNPFNYVSEVTGVFKTQYDTREFYKDAKSLYSANNIMPLDHYNKLQNK